MGTHKADFKHKIANLLLPNDVKYLHPTPKYQALTQLQRRSIPSK